MKTEKNEMQLSFLSKSINEGFARSSVAAFCSQLNPSLEELGDIKTAVSEAVTNAIVHGYPKTVGIVKINTTLKNNTAYIEISDSGIGIEDIEKAREPFYSTKPDEERSGMGFTVMESFMDKVSVLKNKNGGITVKLVKTFEGTELISEMPGNIEGGEECFLTVKQLS